MCCIWRRSTTATSPRSRPRIWRQTGRAARIICEWAGIPIQWVDLGADGGALKTRDGLNRHQQCYIGGSEPKTCPGPYLPKAVLLAATQAQEDEMLSEQDHWWLAKARSDSMELKFLRLIDQAKAVGNTTEAARLQAVLDHDLAAERLKLDPTHVIWDAAGSPKP